MNTGLANTMKVQPLTPDAFAPFGDVIQTRGAREIEINDGHCTRFHDLAKLDINDGGGRALINVFRTRRWEFPLPIKLMEYHDLSSQAFIPLNATKFVVIVAPRAGAIDTGAIKAFVTDGHQGINIHRGVWHHPLVALADEADFLVLDRGGDEMDCTEHHFAKDDQITLSL